MAALDIGEASKVFALGLGVGALGYFLFSKANIQIGIPPTPTTTVGNTLPQTATVPTQIPATSLVAFGQDFADDQYNNSEVWDTRNRTYFSDNILYNKLPYIPLSLQNDFDPQNLPFSQAYDHNIDQDSPRPRFGTHMLDREIADQFYPRKTPLPYYI